LEVVDGLLASAVPSLLGFHPAMDQKTHEMRVRESRKPPEPIHAERREHLAHSSVVVVVRVREADELQTLDSLLLQEEYSGVRTRVSRRGGVTVHHAPAATRQPDDDALSIPAVDDVDFQNPRTDSRTPGSL
jgi:hypothetical protein